MNQHEKPADAKPYIFDPHYSGGYVTVIGLNQPCVIVDSWGDEAQIRSIIDGTEYVFAKRDLIDAEVNIKVQG